MVKAVVPKLGNPNLDTTEANIYLSLNILSLAIKNSSDLADSPVAFTSSSSAINMARCDLYFGFALKNFLKKLPPTPISPKLLNAFTAIASSFNWHLLLEHHCFFKFLEVIIILPHPPTSSGHLSIISLHKYSGISPSFFASLIVIVLPSN